MRRELGLLTLPEPNDVADAIACALCHYYTATTKLEPEPTPDVPETPEGEA
jgi:Holliday junction resolvasome RuvABC endonuclease subunit